MSEGKVHILKNYLHNHDIIAVQETWNTPDRIVDIEGVKSFHFVRSKIHPRALRGAGGVSIFVNHKLKNKTCILKSHEDYIVWLKIKANCVGNAKPIALCVVYFQPEGSSCNSERDDYFELLQNDMLSFKPNFDILVLGDFNARTNNITDFNVHVENWGSENPFDESLESDIFPELFCLDRKSEDKGTVNKYGRKLIEVCKSLNMRIVNGRMNDKQGIYTRVGTTGCSVVDYAIVDSNVAHYIASFQVDKSVPESDHRPLVLGFSPSSENVNLDKMISKENTGRSIYNFKWSKETLHELTMCLLNPASEQLKCKMYDQMHCLEDVNLVTETWSQYFTGAAEKAFKKKVCRPKRVNRAPWIDGECISARQNLLADKSHFLRNTEKQYNSLIQNKKRQYKQNTLKKLEESSVNNLNEFWKTIKSLPSAQQQNAVNVDPHEICQQLQALSSIPQQQYFDMEFEAQVNQFIKNYDASDYDTCIKDDGMNAILNNDIEVEEIVCAVKKLKTGKSPGVDRIPVEFVKECINVIKYDLKALYNYILSCEMYPEAWAQGLRVAIPKGDKDIRPITIEPIFAKVFETILDNRISNINEAFKKTDKYNGGFLKGSMTQDNLFILTACIEKQLCLGKPLYLGFVDFKKAFNYVNHNILFYKLIKNGLKGRFINVLKNMYSKAGAFIKVNNKVYQWIRDTCGTNQGGPLSPNMFRYMLKDLKMYLKDKHGIILDDQVLVHILWADDLVLFAESSEGLQEQLNGLYRFCSKFQMIVNEIKTKVMIYGTNDNNCSFKFNNKTLQIVEEFKYLGVIFNSTRTLKGNIFKQMWPYVSDKATKCSFSISRKCACIGHLTPKIAFQLFDSYVSPILSYAAEIWCKTKEIQCVERVQLRFIKYVLGVKDGTCTPAVLGETGRFPIHLTHIIKLVKYWLRLIQCQESKLVKKAYNVLRTLTEAGYSTWLSRVYELLETYNVTEYHCTNGTLEKDPIQTLSDFKENVYKVFLDEWKKNIQRFPILRSYKLYKSAFKLEDYLFQIRDFKLRRYLSQFRLSSHTLNIEKGRHCKPKKPINERLCQVCKLNMVESEEHFLLQCPLYTNERVKLLTNLMLHEKDVIIQHSTSETFVNLMSSVNCQTQFSLCKFISKGHKLRNIQLA